MSDLPIEQRRLNVLKALEVIPGDDPVMDQICALASDLFDTPIALVTLLDEDHQWLKARHGLTDNFLPRDTAFCNHTIIGDDVLVVHDALQDGRFADSPLVTEGPRVRFYAGAPLEWEPGIRLGALCVIDTKPRSFSTVEKRRLEQLALLVVAQIRLHSANLDLQRTSQDLAIRQSKLEWTSTHDALTGLPNRTLFQEKLKAALDATTPGQRGAMLMVDLDEFKGINDALGHEAGDVLLVAVGNRLTGLVQPPNMVARLGGDEFGILLAEANDEQTKSLTVDISAAFREPVRYGGHSIYCSASIGQAMFPDHASTPTEVVRCADLALYAAKDEGRNKSVLFRAELSDRLQARIAVLGRARNALERNAIVPYYQPKVALGSGTIVGFEALLRWRDPSLGIQSPMTIWDAFQDPVLSVEMGSRMRNLVMADMAAWKKQGVAFGAVAINISAAEFKRGDLATTILESMSAFRLPSDTLELEVTESVLLNGDTGDIGSALRTLSEDGVAISLDDFGTGYASLTHLRQFPVNWLKIDKSFVGDMEESRESAAIVNMCIELAQSFGIGVVAEGVETSAQAEMLKNWNCDLAQGYLFGKPVEARHVPLLLAGCSDEDEELCAAGQRR
ncbi:putative bifunctional diguanylate cyclase/phosphodiesterase [Terrihabitans rhizophilus]|uniref:EAL domain-containing protein n=1 Tax=Terrihabitans rhizophilus TaxID=3092662 RepID=A0ABU4RRA4_9HYPH|nr:EAL domain-containing protein [Terrihabitans sp. PJ23]MDX6807383.1 EAL domain-containing protein [Terrihabitans sp. PJ23]